ncbi:MAG: ABC transporter permease [Anaerolineae bacterium]|nr:ABC transporter permease [Anaerolineae bacterium]MCA9891952.1 ABC transporter permease [Anaerolineae bacterium]MCB9459644.1 ABC transporter permease [Anaerolineaceae bacterium]
MQRYLLQRIFFIVFSLFGATLLAFTASRLAPGDPLRLMAGDQNIPQDVLDEWRARYGLDQPILVQYGYYVGNALQGDLGKSYHYVGTDVTELLGPAIVVTLTWESIAIVFAIIIAVLLGVVSALGYNTWVDTGAMTLALVGISLPDFALATFMVLLFALRLDWLPVAGYETPAHYVLPAITLATRPCALLSRLVRASMLEVLHQDYMTTARAKGLSNRAVIIRHGLRNALFPVLTVIGILIGRILSGSFIVETIFNIPGIGRLGVTAVLQRDYPVILGATLALAVAFLLSTFVIDLLYGVIDPRIRTAG